jgi:hypothetical protein
MPKVPTWVWHKYIVPDPPEDVSSDTEESDADSSEPLTCSIEDVLSAKIRHQDTSECASVAGGIDTIQDPGAGPRE